MYIGLFSTLIIGALNKDVIPRIGIFDFGDKRFLTSRVLKEKHIMQSTTFMNSSKNHKSLPSFYHCMHGSSVDGCLHYSICARALFWRFHNQTPFPYMALCIDITDLASRESTVFQVSRVTEEENQNRVPPIKTENLSMAQAKKNTIGSSAHQRFQFKNTCVKDICIIQIGFSVVTSKNNQMPPHGRHCMLSSWRWLISMGVNSFPYHRLDI